MKVSAGPFFNITFIKPHHLQQAMLTEMFKLIYFLLPVYFADMAPLFFRNSLLSLEKPLDFGFKLKGKRIFGPHKTFRGIIVAILFGTVIFYFQQMININSIIIYRDYSVLLGFFLATGAMFGDTFKSFIKRRLDIAPGKRFFVADQIDAVVGALIFSSFIIDYNLFQIVFMILITFILKLLNNYVAYRLHIRNQKW